MRNELKNLFMCLYFITYLISTSCFSIEAKDIKKNFTNSIGTEFVYIPPGSFMMGSPNNIGESDEHPRHIVKITKGFYLSKYEITQAQWEKVMKNNPSKFKGSNKPVESVTWNSIQIFIRKLNEMEKTHKYALPTEAQWEYASLSGSSKMYCFGNDIKKLKDYAWYALNSGLETHPVGLKKPNKWGLYDMYGNVAEWCQDWYFEAYYHYKKSVDPKGPETGKYKNLRGGTYQVWEYRLRSRKRYKDLGTRYTFPDLGFRLLMIVNK